MAAIIFALCLVLATSAALPHGNRKLEQAAISLLAHTELKGGEILNKFLIERSFKKPETKSQSAALSEAEAFLQELLSTLTTFKDLIRDSKKTIAGRHGTL
ncbi:hypothetical protein ACOMHN_024112 [Nucella lapillus]